MKVFAAATLAVAAVFTSSGISRASGTAVVQQRDGSVKIYRDVLVEIRNEELALTTADGVGTLVIGKAACVKEGSLIKCLPYDATLYQHGWKDRVKVQAGTVWFNPTSTAQQLSYSSARLPAHGIIVSMTTKAGTYVSLTGTVDRVQK